MVTDQEPRYRLKDADGNVVGSLFAESDGTLKLQEGTSGNDNELSLTTQGALEVEQARVTGVLNAKLSRSNIASNVSSGTYINAFDTEDSDPNNLISDVDTEIFPPKDGDYRIIGAVGFTDGGSSDKVQIRVRNNDAGSTVAAINSTNVDLTRFPSINFSFEVALQTGNAYEVQVTSADSTFSVSSDSQLTFCTVKTSLVDN
jgi:hypothetical protein